MTCDCQQSGILTSVDLDDRVKLILSLETPNAVPPEAYRMFKRFAKALMRLCVCAGWSEPLLVTHTTYSEIPCRGSFHDLRIFIGRLYVTRLGSKLNGRP